MANIPVVSVIIATKNEERNIEKCLKSVVSQDFPAEKIEIIVVDNNSADRTVEIVEKMKSGLAPLNLKTFNGGPERSAQRNFGAARAVGKYILYLDADMALSRNLIGECTRKMEADAELAGLYIPEKISGRGFWGKVRDFERSFYDGTAIDAVRFIKRDKFLEAGGFDEKLYAAEDWDLDKRLKKIGKFDIIKNPLFHSESEFSLKKYLAKKKYYSKNFNSYISKWGKNDPDIKKQFGFYYRYFGVFTENRKWKRLVCHPVLAGGMYILRILVGIRYITG